MKTDKSKLKAQKQQLDISVVMVSDCKICNGSGYYMKIGDYDGKIKGRVKCPCNN
jgi:hypothetical protein